MNETPPSRTGVIAATLIGAMMTTASPALAANIVTNGSFESGNFVGGAFGFPNAEQVLPGNSTTLPGWTVSGNELAWSRNGQAGILSQDGLYNLDLTGFFDTLGTYATVTQNLATVAGNTYRLSFYGGNYGPQGSVAAQIIAMAGSTSQTFLIPATTTPQPGGNSSWTNFGFTFTATGASTALSFSGANLAGSRPSFIGLDNISVDLVQAGAVPEPASWAMMISGFGLIGGAMRRRKHQQARVTFA